MSDFEIRELSVEDWEIYKAVRLSSLKESPDSFGSTFEREVLFVDSDWKSRLNLESETNVALPLIAEIDGTAVGLAFGLIWKSEPEVTHVFQMWVSPEARGRGIAKAMLERITIWAEARRCELITLSVTTINKAAANLYQTSGFSPSGPVEKLRKESALKVQPMTRRLGNAA